jgi:hypothetical protein
MFTENFDDYVCDGDSITCKVDGYTVTARVERDDDCGTPWENSDGRGPVSDWRRKDTKKPGERVLVEDRGSCRFYDWQEAIKIAKRDGWDAEPYNTGTKGEQAERAVQREFEVLQAWCKDEWWYVSVTLSVSYGDIDLEDYAASLCGVEANYPGSEGNKYLLEVANELLPEALEVAAKRRAEMLETLAK